MSGGTSQLFTHLPDQGTAKVDSALATGIDSPGWAHVLLRGVAPVPYLSVLLWGHSPHPRIILELFMCDCFQCKQRAHHFTESGAYSIA